MKNFFFKWMMLLLLFNFLYAQSDDLIQIAPVEQQKDSTFLESETIKAHPTKTHTPIPTSTNTPIPTLPPKSPIKKIIKTEKIIQPTPTPTIIKYIDFKILETKVNEILKPKTINNLYGLLETEKKFNLIIILQSIGNDVSFYNTITLKSKNPRILIYEPEKNLQTILPNDKRELIYTFDIITGYDGSPELPLFLHIKALNYEKELPLNIYVELPNPILNTSILGVIILFLLIIMIIILVKLFSGKKRIKNYDFEK